MSRAAALIVAAALLVPAAASAADAPPPAPSLIDPTWARLRVASALKLEGIDIAPAVDSGSQVSVPDPDEYGRISVSHGGGHYHNRREKDIRTLGVEFLPAYAILTGQVVGHSYGSGPTGTIRLLWNLSTANQVILDLSYGTHSMTNPRAMFFRTAVTPNSGFSGSLNIICPALYYAAVLPIGEDFHSPAWLNVKFYLGIGPMIAQSSGKVTNAGTKGTVTGSGSQPFVQFTPGLNFDFRVYDFIWTGIDFKYRLSAPTERPNLTKEFSIPKMYVFETGIDVGYFFY